MYSGKCSKIVVTVIVAIALIQAILASVLPQDYLEYVIAVSRFFDIMLPVLAVGALLKYLCKCPAKEGKCSE